MQPEPVNGYQDYARQCGLNQYYIDPNDDGKDYFPFFLNAKIIQFSSKIKTTYFSIVSGFCRAAIISLASDFNNGAMQCYCGEEGSLDQNCNKIGGQCNCKENIMGRQCTRCKPDFFGFPDCKQCNCPPTARCNEETG